jgi:hypothetical protein
MKFNFAEKEVFIFIFLILFFLFYSSIFTNFLLEDNFWIVLIFGYVVYFLWDDNLNKIKEVENNSKFVESKYRRINFWN